MEKGERVNNNKLVKVKMIPTKLQVWINAIIRAHQETPASVKMFSSKLRVCVVCHYAFR